MREEDAAEQVQRYLERLGYPKYLFASDVRVGYGEKVDFLLYDRGVPRIAVEIKSRSEFPQTKDATSLRFDPHVRQIQSYATSLNAPYYLLTNGEVFLWFATDKSGRPELLANPVPPTPELNASNISLSKDVALRLLQELRDYFFRNGSGSAADEAAISIYAKLLAEKGDNRLERALINSDRDYDGLSQPDLLGIPLQELLHRRYYAGAFKLLNSISFSDIAPKDILHALDEVFIGGQIRYDGPYLPRWLADFLVRLSQIQPNDMVLNIYGNYGQILAAVLMSLGQHRSVDLLDINPNHMSAIWARIQQLVLDNGQGSSRLVVGDIPPYDIWSSRAELPDQHGNLRPMRVIVAPPFGTKLDSLEARRHSSLRLANLSEDLYLELAIDWVKEGGRVTAIVPEGLLLSGNRKSIREFILANTCVTAIISLGAFLPFSKVKTSILVLDKRVDSTSYDTFMFHISKITSGGVFDCREILPLAEALDAFNRWMTKHEFSAGPASALVSSKQLDISNMSVSHYIARVSPSRNDLASEYATARLAELTIEEIRRGSNIRLDENGDLPVIGPGMIRPMLLDFENIGRTVKDRVPLRARTVRPGDIVLNIIGTHSGAAAIVEENLDGVLISYHVMQIKADKRRILPEYLALALNSAFARDQIERAKTGSVIKALSTSALKEIIIPVPSATVQRLLIERMKKARDNLFSAQEQLRNAEMSFTKSIEDLSEWGLE